MHAGGWLCLCIILTCTISIVDSTSTFRNKNYIHLRSRQFDTRVEQSYKWQQETGRKRMHEDFMRKKIFLVQHYDSTYEEDIDDFRAALPALDAEALHYVPHNAWTVYCSIALALELQNKFPQIISWVGELQPEDRYDPELVEIIQNSVEEHVPDYLIVSVVPSQAGAVLQQVPRLGYFRQNEARAELSGDNRIKAVCSHTVISSRRRCYLELIHIFSWMPEVSFVSPEYHPRFLQNTIKPLIWDNAPQPAYGYGPQAKPYPLDGTGMIISAADSGIDYGHCWFWDPGRGREGVPYNNIDMGYRKIIAYFIASTGDRVDGNGHGTHVTGAAIGKCYNSSWWEARYEGIASGAQMAFVDIGPPSSELNTKQFEVPNPKVFTNQIYDRVYGAGSIAHFDAWGASTPLAVYSDRAQLLDEWSYSHWETLLIRSAGNNDEFFSTITSDATAKNTLSVGYSQDLTESYYLGMQFRDYSIPGAGYASNASINQDVCCNKLPNLGFRKTYCCEPDLYASIPQFYARGNLANSSSKGPTRDLRIKPEAVVPAEYTLSARFRPYGTNDTVLPHGLKFGEANDITRGLNELKAEGGTSQAAAIVGGMAAIVAQFFNGSYYPPGATIPQRIYPPGAALLKAVLVNSARHLDGRAYANGAWTPVQNTTSMWQGVSYFDGFGVMSLKRAIPLKGEATNLVVLSRGVPFVRSNILVERESQWYCLQATNAGEVAVTLSWLDPEGFSTGSFATVNDLDLAIYQPFPMLANAMVDPNTGNYTTDTFNNIERILINVKAGDLVSINVTAKSIPRLARSQPYQPFALVATGPGLTYSTKCVQCEPGTRLICYIPNGIGQRRCAKNSQWGPCRATSCRSASYTITATGGCTAFASFQILLLAGSAIFIVIMILSCFPISFVYTRWAAKREREGRKPDLWDMYSIMKPEIVLLVFGAAVTLLGSSFSLLQPILVSQLIAGMNTAQSWWELRFTMLKLIGTMVGEFVSNLAAEVITQVGMRRTLSHLRTRLFRAIVYQPYAKLENVDRGELQNRIMVDTTFVVSFPVMVLSTFGSALIRCIVGTIISIIISWQLTLVFLCTVPLMAALAYAYSRVIFPKTQRQLEALAEASSVLYDTLLNFKLVKLFGNEDEEIRRFSNALERNEKASHSVHLFQAIQNAGKLLLIHISTLILLFYGAYLVIQNTITYALLITFFLYSASSLTGAAGVLGLYASYTSAVASFMRLWELSAITEEQITDEPQKLPSNSKDQIRGATMSKSNTLKNGGSSMQRIVDANKRNRNIGVAMRQRSQRVDEGLEMQELPSQPGSSTRRGEMAQGARGEIQVRGLGFSYPSAPQTHIFTMPLNIILQPNKVHAIVGPSGSGKTTLLNLLARLYTPTHGCIMLDNQDINNMTHDQFLNLIGVVEQQPRLFNRTVFENIAYGRLNASEQLMMAVAKAVNLDTLIDQMPAKAQTKVGENSGISMSGGQKQRVAIARALLRDPPILLLDEPTSELDVANQQNILEIIFRCAKMKTIILVTHHIASIERADCIYFMQNGRLVEYGKHWDLVDRRGAYFRFLQLCNAVTTRPQARARTTRMMNARSRPPGGPQDGQQQVGGDVMTPINQGPGRSPQQPQQPRGPPQQQPQPQRGPAAQQQQQPQQQQQQPQQQQPRPPAQAQNTPFNKSKGAPLPSPIASPVITAPPVDPNRNISPPLPQSTVTQAPPEMNPLWAPRNSNGQGQSQGQEWVEMSQRVRNSFEADPAVVNFMQPLAPQAVLFEEGEGEPPLEASMPEGDFVEQFGMEYMGYDGDDTANEEHLPDISYGNFGQQSAPREDYYDEPEPMNTVNFQAADYGRVETTVFGPVNTMRFYRPATNLFHKRYDDDEDE